MGRTVSPPSTESIPRGARGCPLPSQPCPKTGEALIEYDRLGITVRTILEADAEIVEERKLIKPSNPSGVPVWSHAGIVCTGEAYKKAVKLTFAHGASIPDPSRLFNSSLEGNMRRAIDIREGENVNARRSRRS